LAFLTQNKAKFSKKIITTLIFEKNAIFFAENCQKLQKIVTITSTPGHTVKSFLEPKTRPSISKAFMKPHVTAKTAPSCQQYVHKKYRWREKGGVAWGVAWGRKKVLVGEANHDGHSCKVSISKANAEVNISFISFFVFAFLTFVALPSG
jgi:hypothetical protein